ncbi:MAG: NUDIX domain-containing protein [Pseudomonadota bacterium]
MDLFVYGTLQSTSLMQAVAGGAIPSAQPARLAGYVLRPLAGDVVPFVQLAEDETVQGFVFAGLCDQQAARLQAYEGAFGYALAPVTVTTDAGPVQAQCYMPPPGQIPGIGSWSYTAWQANHEVPAVFAAQELFAHDPMPDPAKLRAMWPMIEARAWAKHRASAGPAVHRYHPAQDDIAILDQRPPVGDFFRFQRFTVAHKQFQGRQSDPLSREIFVGIDAAILLPYDPMRDRVLLVEQLRLGPALRADPNPWMLEPVAGIVDARETPEQAARREAVEEAGVTLTHLEHAGAFYPSPGSSTDYFYTYVGLCDLPADTPYLGGMPGENEDLRLHPLSFDQAMTLLDTGEIATGPLFYLLYWLARHRDRLRSLS